LARRPDTPGSPAVCPELSCHIRLSNYNKKAFYTHILNKHQIYVFDPDQHHKFLQRPQRNSQEEYSSILKAYDLQKYLKKNSEKQLFWSEYQRNLDMEALAKLYDDAVYLGEVEYSILESKLTPAALQTNHGKLTPAALQTNHGVPQEDYPPYPRREVCRNQKFKSLIAEVNLRRKSDFKSPKIVMLDTEYLIYNLEFAKKIKQMVVTLSAVFTRLKTLANSNEEIKEIREKCQKACEYIVSSNMTVIPCDEAKDGDKVEDSEKYFIKYGSALCFYCNAPVKVYTSDLVLQLSFESVFK
jgi:hypothetical protein